LTVNKDAKNNRVITLEYLYSTSERGISKERDNSIEEHTHVESDFSMKKYLVMAEKNTHTHTYVHT